MTTTEASPTPDEQGSMPGTTKGADAQTAQPEPGTQTAPEARFTQEQVDSIIKARLAENTTKVTTRLEKAHNEKLAAALAERDQSLATQVEERLQARLIEQALETTRTAIQEEYGLTDAQLARLTGDTPDALKADAETLFAPLKDKTPRKPPVIKTGGEATPEQPLDLKNMSAAQIREKAPEIRKQLAQR